MRGYANVEKQLGLTMDHYELVLQKLARWHAANAILKEKVSIFFVNVINCYFSLNHPKHSNYRSTWCSISKFLAVIR